MAFFVNGKYEIQKRLCRYNLIIRHSLKSNVLMFYTFMN